MNKQDGNIPGDDSVLKHLDSGSMGLVNTQSMGQWVNGSMGQINGSSMGLVVLS